MLPDVTAVKLGPRIDITGPNPVKKKNEIKVTAILTNLLFIPPKTLSDLLNRFYK